LITLGNEPSYTDALNQFFEILMVNAPADFEWKYLPLENDDHSSVPLKSLYSGLEYLFAAWIVPTHLAGKGAVAIKAHYDQLSQRYGYQVGLPEATVNQFFNHLFQENKYKLAVSIYEDLRTQFGYQGDISEATINGWGYQLFFANNVEEAIEVFKMNVEKFPESSNVYDSLGEAYERIGELEQARQNFEMAVQKAEQTNHTNLEIYRTNLARVTKILGK